ncbi:Protein kinase superfamily protein [Klebsormidium nitens]|uniref:Protein kinase superfamily protein n=1 Tax=Klebsormidium nitens TaxID=105231 RepID=A0A1Y1HLT4_KLENI|nr:Protein kinase superfamily protein [Klebsormidium nitens]|eukprot:GAQ78953.1 Protein kinase superfamily protein [Klebsormidium nitens]
MPHPAVTLRDVSSGEQHRLPVYGEVGPAVGRLEWDAVLKAFEASKVLIEDFEPALIKQGLLTGMTVDQFADGSMVLVTVTKKVEGPPPADYPPLLDYEIRFKRLLEKTYVSRPHTEVLDTIVSRLPQQMMLANTPARALDIYEQARLMPGVSTKNHLLTQHQLRVNGPLFTRLEDGPLSLLKATDVRGRLCVVKMLPDAVPLNSSNFPGGSEGRACHQLLPGAKKEGAPLIEAEVLELRVTQEHGSTRHAPGRYAALLSIQYVGTVASCLQLTEEVIERGARRILHAVRYMHARNFVHMDIKSDNIFLESDGRWYLGDLGSTVPTNTPVLTTTTWFTGGKWVGEPAKEEYDFYMLAVVVGVELDKTNWKDRLIENSHTPPHKLVAALQSATRPSLIQLIEEILRSAGLQSNP